MNRGSGGYPAGETAFNKAASAARKSLAQEDLLPVEREEVLLVGVEAARSWRVVRVEAHAPKGHNVGHRRNQDLAVVIEADEATVKQVVGTGRQE